MATQKWTEANISSQESKTVLITGANSGLGLQAAMVLSAKGAHVIMTARNIEKGQEAIAGIKRKFPNAKIELMHMDLADFDSIRKFSVEFHHQYSQLDILINNAGIMSPKHREATKQNMEVQFGVNHLGHFLLTGLLLDVLKNTPHSRVVVQSSNAHHEKFMKPAIHFDDLNWEKSYNRFQSYSQSKLANLLFAYELDRKLKANQLDMIVTAAHPGWTKTNLQNSMGFFVTRILNNIIGQDLPTGTLPILRAATEENLKGKEYFGPTRMNGLRGNPELVKSSNLSYDQALAKKLWEVSEKITGITYKFN
ncbi:oxidoreductase [Mucilaginibacter sp. KACC 22063]|uniref:oxidoreductase n=1 Tax=Mucilaginibacter sp. KACC 22063 TaxID=3025666 RepID=UPI0023653884|nr:oxidoreductase [Mucilaginibacter sp. KACC 22063]WDF55598.1 oxidoreductase [Mucilaginibacter sp. KACC 22063]